VVTDGGTLAAHASLVAREYGIPAVVGTGDATDRLHTGRRVTEDATPAPFDPNEPPAAARPRSDAELDRFDAELAE